MHNNQYYKNKALASLEGKWSTAAIATFIYLIISTGVNWTTNIAVGDNMSLSLSTTGFWTLLCLPLGWGFTVFFLRLIREEELDYGRLFDGYKDFLRIFLAEFLLTLVISIGFLLLFLADAIKFQKHKRKKIFLDSQEKRKAQRLQLN